MKDIVFQTDATGLWTFLNPAWTEVTNFTIEESLGQLFLNYVWPEDRQLNQERFTPLIERRKEYCRHQIRYIVKGGNPCWMEVYARLTLDENDNIIGTSGMITDINERKMMELELEQYRNHLEELVKQRTNELNKINKQLQYLATHDWLTNIPNRYALEEAVTKSINNDGQCKAVLLFIDVDNFKVINDTFGHAMGDATLKYLAKLFKAARSPNDVLARLGGDEFAVLMNNTSLERGVETADKLLRLLDDNEIFIENISLNLTASIGAVPINGSLDVQKLLTYADTALYAAKDNGKNRAMVIQSTDDKDKMSQTNKILNAIKDALKHDNFVMYYQPIYKIDNGRENVIGHYEALIRMRDAEGNLIPPVEFIPTAERFGLMSQIDKWVLQNVITKMQRLPNIKVFINISGISFGDRELLKKITTSIIASGIDPSHLGFEITETTAIRDLVQSERWIRELKTIGCKFALDDFGVGFSSFSYLSSLPIDYLKIDGSFVKNLDKDPKQKALIQAIHAVAHILGKETIAEFVKNEAILTILNELNLRKSRLKFNVSLLRLNL